MSFNQSKSDKSDSQYWKPGRSGSSGSQRGFSGSGGGKGGGGGGGTAPPSSSSLNSSRSYKKPGSGQGGQSRVSSASKNSDSNVAASAARAVQNGAHVQVQPPLPEPSDLPKPANSPSSRSTRAVPRAPSSQSTAGVSDSMAPATPAKGDVSKAFPLQFGTISPGFMNGMQIPARTSSAPPNLDEQKRDQARHDSFRAAVPALPIPSAPKQQQQQSRKDTGIVNESNPGESHTPTRRDVHVKVPASPVTTASQKPSVLPIAGISMPMPFQPQQVPIPFGAPNSQIQSQGITATSLQMQMPMSLPMGNAAQVQQQVFVPGLQPHPLHPQGHGFAPQIGHQMAPQFGIAPPQFVQQPAGKFVGSRKAVKITHPETHEELRLGKRSDPYLDGGSSGSRSHHNVTPQSQPIQSYAPAHQIPYYSPLPPNSYNPAPIFFQTQSTHPLTSTQMTSGPQASRYNYPVGQGSQGVSFMNPSALNPLPVNKFGPPMHGVGVAEPTNSEHTQDAQTLASSASSASIQVKMKPLVDSVGDKVGSSSVTISSPAVSKGESPKLLRPPKESRTLHPQKDTGISSESSSQHSKSIFEPSSLTAQQSATVSGQVLSPSITSTPAFPTEETTSVLNNTEGRRRDVRSSDSLKDHSKKLNRKDPRQSQSPHQEDISDSTGSSKSHSLKIVGEVAKHPENTLVSPLESVGLSTTISSFPSQGLQRSSSSQDETFEAVEGEGTTATSETSRGVLQSTEEPLPNSSAGPDDFEMAIGGVRIGEVSTSVPSNKSDLELVGTVSGIPDAACSAEKDDCTLPEVQLGQKMLEIVEQEKIKPSEGPKQDGITLEENKEIEQDSNVKETTVGKVSGLVETEHKTNGELGCSSEVDRMADNLVRSAITSSDSVDAESSPSVSSTISLDNKTSIANESMASNERTDNKDVSVTEADMLDQVSAPVPTPISSEVTEKFEGKGTETISHGPDSISVSGSKDRSTLEPNRVKSSAARVKKKRKDILKAADAAGSTSDLYMAYKGPEEKQEIAVSSESVDSSLSVDMKQVPSDDVEKDFVASEDDLLSKAEPDDWEDAADISTPKLETSDNGRLVLRGSMHPDEDGSGLTGRKKYSRDFLLTLSEQYTDLPEGFETESDITDALMSGRVVDRESYLNSGRIIDRPSGAPRLDRRGNGMVDDDKWNKISGPFASGRDPRLEFGPGGAVVGFRPGQGGSHGVLKNMRGQSSGQFGGGILSGPMQSLASPGGMQWNSPDADRWQRAAGFQKGLIPYPQTPLMVMHKAEKKYEVGKVSDEEALKQRQLKGILNKLTPQNFEKLFEQVKEVNIDNDVTLTGVISQIFDKALTEPTFCEMYANFCYHLASEMPDFVKNNEKITFKRVLLNKCQEEFERGEREQAEADRVEEEGEIKCSEEEREEKKVKARRRMLGNIRLIGELYKKRMLTERIMHECIKKLLGQYQNPDEENIEALCKLMSTIGEMIDHPKAKEHMDAYFDMMTKLSNNMKLSSRVRFMLRDAIDLRKNKWQQRRKVEGPKKIEEVHRDAAQERQAQASRLARSPSIGSSARRGQQPMDFGPRGSTMFSPNSHMGGLRGLAPQVRGYAQDVRLEPRHPYESRMLPVPLSQRPIDDDSITLGPQGGLARGMSIRGQPLMSGVPSVDMSPSSGDSRRVTAGPNGYSSASDWTPYNSREDVIPRYVPDRVTGMPPAHDQLNSHDYPSYFVNRDLRSADPSYDRSMATSSATFVQGSSSVAPVNVALEKVVPEEHQRDMSIAAIREFYSAKDEGEVALCMKDLNSPSFYPSMISIWVTDSFERKDMERDLLAKLLVNLTNSQDSLLSQVQLIQGFESVLATLEDAVNDAPKAAEFLGRILAKVIMENIVPLRDIGQLIHEGGEEPGRLLQIGLASEVLGSILEAIRLEKGESVLNEIRTSSNLRLEDFRPPDPIKSRKLEGFI